jgi:hypothetical protein
VTEIADIGKGDGVRVLGGGEQCDGAEGATRAMAPSLRTPGEAVSRARLVYACRSARASTHSASLLATRSTPPVQALSACIATRRISGQPPCRDSYRGRVQAEQSKPKRATRMLTLAVWGTRRRCRRRAVSNRHCFVSWRSRAVHELAQELGVHRLDEVVIETGLL